MKKKLLSAALCAAMIASLACTGVYAEEDAEQYVNTYLSAEPTTMDISLRMDTYSSEILINVMEGLIRLEQRDGEYVFMPGDAESWEVSDDGTVWTFHLGEDRYWSDGEPVTADQYVYSLQRSADPATGCPNSYFIEPILNYDKVSTGEADVSELGVKALDEHTLEITLASPMASFLESTDASVYYPQRQDIVEQYGDQYGTEANTMVYNGPFVLTEWTHNSSLKLEKNEYYWDKDSVSLSYVSYQILEDTTALANAYESGQIDVISVSSQEAIDQYLQDESNVYTKVSGGTISFAFYNTEDELFSNLNIRKAFTLGVDIEEMNSIGFSGLREELYGWIAPALSVDGTSMRSVAGDPLKEMKEEMEAEGKTAQDILIEGMQELGLGDDPSTLEITFSLGGTGDWYHTFGEYLQQVYKMSLGVDIEIEFNDWGIFSSNLESGNYQIGFMGWGAYYNDPYDMLSIHISDFNQLYTNWSNEEYDALCKAGKSEMDADARMQDYIDAEKILLENYVVCPFATSCSHQFTKSFLHDRYAEYGEDNLYFVHSGWKNVYTSGR